MFSFIKKNPEAIKQEKTAQLWNIMTSMSKKDKALFIQLIEQENEPLMYKKGEEPNASFLKNKKLIHKYIQQVQQGSRLYDYTCFKFQDDVYALLDESYDQFYGIVSNHMF